MRTQMENNQNKLNINQKLNYIYRTFTGNYLGAFKPNIFPEKQLSPNSQDQRTEQNKINNFPILDSNELTDIPDRFANMVYYMNTEYLLDINNYGIFDYLIIGLALKLVYFCMITPVIIINYIFEDNVGEYNSIMNKIPLVIAFVGGYLISITDFIARNVFACIGTAALLPVLAISEATGFSDYIEPMLPVGMINYQMSGL